MRTNDIDNAYMSGTIKNPHFFDSSKNFAPLLTLEQAKKLVKELNDDAIATYSYYMVFGYEQITDNIK